MTSSNESVYVNDSELNPYSRQKKNFFLTNRFFIQNLSNYFSNLFKSSFKYESKNSKTEGKNLSKQVRYMKSEFNERILNKLHIATYDLSHL